MDNFGGQSNNMNLGQNLFPEESKYSPMASDLYGQSRVAFIRKVYTILSIQLGVTVLMTGISMASESFFVFQVQNMWLLIVCIIVALVIEIYILCCNGGRDHPQNIICLGIFTLCESYIVSCISSMTGKTSGNGVVFLAAFMTLGIVVGCTAYACYTKTDFTTCGGIIVVLSVVLLMLFIATLFTSSPLLTNIYCGVGVLLFGIYLVIDTQMIMGGKQIELTVDEYVLAAMLLYIDIITIFLYLLQLLSNKE